MFEESQISTVTSCSGKHWKVENNGALDIYNIVKGDG